MSQALRSHADGRDPHTRDLVFYLIDADNFKEVNDQLWTRRWRQGPGRNGASAQFVHSPLGRPGALGRRRIPDRIALHRSRRSRITGATRSVCRGRHTVQHGGIGRQPCTARVRWDGRRSHGFSTSHGRSATKKSSRWPTAGLRQAKQAGKNRAVGILPASGKRPATTIEGFHTTGLQVDLLAVAGPASGHT